MYDLMPFILCILFMNIPFPFILISGQGLYIRQANPVQAQGLMAGVQATITPTLRGTAQPTMQVI